MESQGYYDWLKAGKPYTLQKPANELRATIAGYGYVVYHYPNDDHLKATTPEDHTPFSYTGWPNTSRLATRWVGRALDVMPKNDDIKTIAGLAKQIIADKDAKVPGTEWIKYINWTDIDGSCWHVSWQPGKVVRASSDKGHIHISGRDDMDNASTQGYDPVARMSSGGAGGNTDMPLRMGVCNGRYWTGDTVFRRAVRNWPEHEALKAMGGVEKDYGTNFDAMCGEVGRIDADQLASDAAQVPTFTEAQIDQLADQLANEADATVVKQALTDVLTSASVTSQLTVGTPKP